MGWERRVDDGFYSHPKQQLEMPPTWVLGVGMFFLLGALGFWVCKKRNGEDVALSMVC